jgi:hypothetical protein
MKNGFRQKTKYDKHFIPKIRLNEAQDLNLIPNFPVNKAINYDQGKIIQAIQNGMILLLTYKGEKDDSPNGHERVIYPMVLGINKNTKNTLIRGWHLDGYSVNVGEITEKVWRLFNVDNILSMTFTGNFYRLPPAGYKMNDRIMTERTIQRADFNQIRRNQNKLVQSGKIESEEETTMHTKITISNIQVKNSGTELDLRNPWQNPLLKEQQGEPKKVKISILNSILGDNWLAILGAIGSVGRSVKVYDENNQVLGTYKTVDTFTGDDINKHRVVRGKSVFPAYIFEKKK